MAKEQTANQEGEKDLQRFERNAKQLQYLVGTIETVLMRSELVESVFTSHQLDGIQEMSGVTPEEFVNRVLKSHFQIDLIILRNAIKNLKNI